MTPGRTTTVTAMTAATVAVVAVAVVATATTSPVGTTTGEATAITTAAATVTMTAVVTARATAVAVVVTASTTAGATMTAVQPLLLLSPGTKLCVSHRGGWARRVYGSFAVHVVLSPHIWSPIRTYGLSLLRYSGYVMCSVSAGSGVCAVVL